MSFNQDNSREVMAERLFDICVSLKKVEPEPVIDMTHNERAYKFFISRLQPTRIEAHTD